MLVMKNATIYETDFAEYEYLNSVLTVKCKNALVVDKAVMEQMLLDAVKLTNYERYYAIIDLTNNVQSNTESRNYYAKNELNKYRLADAFVVNSFYIQSLTNFYLRVKKPIVPSKMFNDLESAKKWINFLKDLTLSA